MPITIPAATQYQAPLVAMPGLWNKKPVEGDKFISCEIDWGAPVNGSSAIQFSLSSFSPVEFSQIVAMAVDNGRNDADVSFLFPDTGKQLTVPAGNQGIFPVITNALQFYVVSQAAVTGDITVFEILNSMPPPVAILPAQVQTTTATVSGISLNTVAVTPIIPGPTSGVLQSATMNLAIATGASPATQAATIQLVDGNGVVLWAYSISYPASTTANVPIELASIRQRFNNGLNFRVLSSNLSGTSTITINAYWF